TPGPYTTAGILPSWRSRRAELEPEGRPASASKMNSAMGEELLGCDERATQHRRHGTAEEKPIPAPRSGEVVAPEDLRHRGVLEHGVDGVGDELGHREDL